VILRLEAALARLWWQRTPGTLARALSPLSWLYRALAALHRRWAGAPETLPVPVVVVGNLVVGGAGKTPVVIALALALQAAGRRPGIIARGHGGRAAKGTLPVAVLRGARAEQVGDEPLLIHRRTGLPVFVGRDRAAVARALCAAHPEVDVIVSDDGLQHPRLARQAEILVFDDRGVGNGLLLPAGPLRQPLAAAVPAWVQVIYTGRGPSTALPGTVVPRTMARALPLPAWRNGKATGAVPLASLRGRRLTALAGIGAPEQFFAALEAAGLEIERLPQRDHATYEAAPWPIGTREVITTEKDAVKLVALPDTGRPELTVWVLPLDCALPPALVRAVLAQIAPTRPAAEHEPSQDSPR